MTSIVPSRVKLSSARAGLGRPAGAVTILAESAAIRDLPPRPREGMRGAPRYKAASMSHPERDVERAPHECKDAGTAARVIS